MSAPHPKQIGKYQILDHVATGGMAELFKAKLEGNLGFEKLVAIKKILPQLQADLPAGIQITTMTDRTTGIQASINTSNSSCCSPSALL